MKFLIKNRLVVLACIAIIAIGTGLLVWKNNHQSEIPYPFGGDPEIIGLDEPPAVGNLNGVHVSIPAAYQFFPVNYKGEDVWSGKKLKEKSTFETPIASFGIRVRLPDMSPKTKNNEKEWNYHTFGDGEAFCPWITVGVKSKNEKFLPGLKKGGEDWIKRSREPHFVGNRKDWRYQKIDEKRFGLTTEVMVGPDINKYDSYNKDILYDELTWNTLIKCDAGPIYKSESGDRTGRHSCEQKFYIPEVNSTVDFKFCPEYLKDWKENQEKITLLIQGFIVE